MRILPLVAASMLIAFTGNSTEVCLAQSQKPLPYLDPSLPKEQRAADLVTRMTLEEKVAEMMNSAAAIPRLNVPAFDWWNEGLHGVARAGYATMFPQAIGMAATWDAPLIRRVATVISEEARAKNNDALRHNNHSIYYGLTFWSPNINIFRDPRWGRGQETYGEDPYLTSQIGVQFVEGMQGENPNYYRTIATPKHFAVHSGPESERHRFDVMPSPHDLWDTYLPAFRATIVDAKADSTMCAYNAIYGQPACGSDLLMQTILRGYWNFQGYVTSDCGAVDDFWYGNGHHTSADSAHAAADALLHGTDTNCGETYRSLADAVKHGILGEADIDVSLRRLFLARMKLGLFDPPAMVPYTSIPFSDVHSPAHQALALETAEQAIVLLKNDGILPLKTAMYKTIAIIGPNAASLAALEGNYNGAPRDPQMPVDALKAALPKAHIVYEQGAPYAEGIELPAPRTLFRPAADAKVEGLRAEYFANDAFAGKPAISRIDPELQFDWDSANPLPGATMGGFSVRWTGVIVPPGAGKYEFTLHAERCRQCDAKDHVTIVVDGKPVITWITGAPPAPSSTEAASTHGHGPARFIVEFADTQPQTIQVEMTRASSSIGGGISLYWKPPTDLLLSRAVEAAKSADLVVAMIGLSPEIEGEEMPIHVEGFSGGDRTDIKLPYPQETLLEQVATTGKPMVVVLLNGSALAVNWAKKHANAILEAWYPGETGGKAITETLMGKSDPSGRLPVTFYTSVDDLPAFADYSMKNRTYRYYSGEVLYRFGYGLSYTRFTYSHLKLSTSKVQAGDTLTAEADVHNSGNVAGDEVAELYLMSPPDGNGGLSPHIQLEGFQRIHLLPGQTRTITFQLSPRQLSEVDAEGVRSVQSGRYKLSVGSTQPGDSDLPEDSLTGEFTISGSQEMPH